jgi:hypothetical protein
MVNIIPIIVEIRRIFWLKSPNTLLGNGGIEMKSAQFESPWSKTLYRRIKSRTP